MTEPRVIDKPREGFWLIKLVKNGPEVAAAIILEHTTYEPGNALNRMDRSATLAAYIDGHPCHIDEVWLRRGRPIDEREYRFRIRDTAWLREHAPDDPGANPKTAIDSLTVKPPF